MAISLPRIARSSASDISPMSLPLNLMRPPTIFADVGQVAHDAERHRRLAAAGFADDAHRLARHDVAGEVHDGGDLAALGEEGDGEVLDLQDGIGAFDVRGDSFIVMLLLPSPL
jgi:hypothetical protein